jgi:UDP-GlcNAc:undecaprenyl-phosphate GlcNAc-1-phosphate transferase
VVPLLDTFLVIVSRTRAKRSIAIGGRDHTSHRLVALGLSERKAVGVLYGLGLLGAIGAYLAVPSSLIGVLTVFSAMTVLAVLFGIFLLDIAVYPPAPESTTPRARENFPIHIQNLVEIALDVCAVSVCWLAAHLIRFHDAGGLMYFRESTVIPFLPFVIVSKVFAVLVFRLYRGIWRSIVPRDIYQIFKASVLGTLLLFAGLYFATRFVNVSRAALILDGLFCFFALVGTRTALIAFRRWARRIASRQLKAVFVGEESLLPWVEEAIRAERGIDFQGLVAPGSSDELEALVKEKKIDVILTSRDMKEDLFRTVLVGGVLVRRIKAYLA